MGILTESTKKIKDRLIQEIEAETATIAADIAARLPKNEEIDSELNELQKRPEPTQEAKEEAARLIHQANEIREKINSKLNKEILPLIDQLIAAHRKAAMLTMSTSGFILSSYIDDIKSILTRYHNDVVMGWRESQAKK
ncbi:hypothetical protein L7E55_14455 [Pelotomaculum isophthalicicum JI]|uniref:Uncharacterized protein n=1 Tax=Pelotomaculum isophthalicicum JI TaxID=947010 RepID=A0A9X4H922_9FIRM|nr:hypothetical protein [Pelotomaculum isophthalicicum]MDF9409544.1 hypothetical protein [Pelotomaculum isophthalicicum JI]